MFTFWKVHTPKGNEKQNYNLLLVEHVIRVCLNLSFLQNKEEKGKIEFKIILLIVNDN